MSGITDVLVLGLGGMGSAALAHIAARGRRVMGLEQFGPTHTLGSSHGRSRVIRQAYFEHPAYVRLLRRAYELWEALEHDMATPLLLRTGALMVGPEDGVVVPGSTRSALEHDLPHEVLDAAAIRRRFPQLRPWPDEWGVYETAGGILFPEDCVLAHLRQAVASGAEARFGTRVTGWRASGSALRVETDRGAIETGMLVVTAGPWLAQIPGHAIPLEVERNVMHWFEPLANSSHFLPGSHPVWLVERPGEPIWYGMPAVQGDPPKCAIHHGRQIVTPQSVDRTVAPAEIESARRFLDGWIPDAAGRHQTSTVCLYTNSPDEHFVVGGHPSQANVLIAGGFSGHGFKFCSVVGEILADLATEGETRHPIALFDPRRFQRVP